MKPIVCLDAGHFGKRNQSPVVPEYYEAKQMWDLHLKLKKRLEYFGFKVLTTRAIQTKDLAVYERGQKAKGCDLFISLHSNAVGIVFGESNTDRVSVYSPFDNINDSHKLGQILADVVADCMGVSKGVVKTRLSEHGEYEYYGVMRGARSVNCPLYYILEHSFHTNENSAKWLMSQSNLDKLAYAEAEAIAEYFGLAKPKEVKTVIIELTQLKKGAKGAEVRTLQCLLKSKGYAMPKYGADGSFGSETETAVKAFQKIEGLSVDGIVGKNTWTKLLKG